MPALTTWNSVLDDIEDRDGREWLYIGNGDRTNRAYYVLHETTASPTRSRAESRRMGRRHAEEWMGGHAPVRVRTMAEIDRNHGLGRRYRAADRDHADHLYREKAETPGIEVSAAPPNAAYAGTYPTKDDVDAPEGYVAKAAVLREAQRVRAANNWCKDGFEESMARLNIPVPPERHEVVVTVSVTVDGSREDARQTVVDAATGHLSEFVNRAPSERRNGRVAVQRISKVVT